ncbi:hypothetical protein KUCAC02_032825, partial [Chaenocephalus aceratus]
VSLLVPLSYLLFWVLLLGFSLYSEPVVCGVGLVIMLTGVPVYFLGVHWKEKPKCIYKFIASKDGVMLKFLYLNAQQFYVLRIYMAGIYDDVEVQTGSKSSTLHVSSTRFGCCLQCSSSYMLVSSSTANTNISHITSSMCTRLATVAVPVSPRAVRTLQEQLAC